MPHVLVIDDDPQLAALLREYLGSRGYTVDTAPDGPRGLARLKQGPVDLVVLDVMMPGMDGFEVCRALRREHAVPVIMLTAPETTLRNGHWQGNDSRHRRRGGDA